MIRRTFEFHPLMGCERNIKELESTLSLGGALAVCDYHEIASRKEYKSAYREFRELLKDILGMGYQRERNLRNVMNIEYPNIKYIHDKGTASTRRIKPLSLVFGLETLTKECEREGWEIPSFEDVKGRDIGHPSCWVTNKPEDETLHKTHGMYYIAKTDSLIVLSKSFAEKSVVLV